MIQFKTLNCKTDKLMCTYPCTVLFSLSREEIPFGTAFFCLDILNSSPESASRRWLHPCTSENLFGPAPDLSPIMSHYCPIGP